MNTSIYGFPMKIQLLRGNGQWRDGELVFEGANRRVIYKPGTENILVDCSTDFISREVRAGRMRFPPTLSTGKAPLHE